MLISPAAALADVDQAVGGGFALQANVLGLVVVPPTPNVTLTATEPDDGFDEVADVVGPVDVLGVVGANVLHVETLAIGVFGENHDAEVTTEASAADLGVGGLTGGITADAVGSTCTSNGDGSTGSVEIVDLRLGDTPITDPEHRPQHHHQRSRHRARSSSTSSSSPTPPASAPGSPSTPFTSPF